MKAISDTVCYAQDTCYHCPFAHPGLCEALDLSEYHSVCYEANSFQFSPLAPLDERPTEGQSEWDIVTGPRFDGEITVSPLHVLTACCLQYAAKAFLLPDRGDAAAQGMALAPGTPLCTPTSWSTATVCGWGLCGCEQLLCTSF